MLAELLPLDESRRSDGRVALTFLAYTAVRPAAPAPLHEDTVGLIGFIAEQVRVAQAAGEAGAGTIPPTPRSGCWRSWRGSASIYSAGTTHRTPHWPRWTPTWT